MKRLFWPRRKEGEAREGAFTRYVRSLAKDAPGDEDVEAVLRELRGALRAELRRRGLWNSPPAYFGVLGWGSWEERSGSGKDALDELVSDAYAFVFLDRKRHLRVHLAIKPNIDGLVLRALHQFVQERQEAHDPLGARVYGILRTALREALKAGELHLLQGSDRIGNDTVLGFAAGVESGPQAVDLRPLVARWNGLLMPGLITNRGRHQEEVVRVLRGLLPELKDEGAPVFRFKDLIDPFKADIRARWASALEHEGGEKGVEAIEGEEPRRIPLVQPNLAAEERQFLRKVMACVLESIARLAVSEATRGYLYRLWQFRRMHAASGDGREVSARKLEELLEVPRERIPELDRRLLELVQRCRAAISGKAAVTSLEGAYALGAS
jgi:hypothetical protein